MVTIRCPACSELDRAPYILVGAPVKCPSCGKTSLASIPEGTILPRTGYELTFQDFRQLIDNQYYRPRVTELLCRWFGLDARWHTNESMESIAESDYNLLLELVKLHQRIQANPAWQKELYRAAMALWR